MIKKITNRIGMIIIVLTIVIFNLLIGGNEKDLPILPISILLILTIVILLIKKIKLKESIVINSKVDMAVLIFMLSLCLPLLLKTYCTYQGTVEFIIKYFFVYSFYLLIRNIVNSDKKSTIVINTTIISSLIIILFGLDLLFFHQLSDVIRHLNLHYTTDNSLSSTFGYANTVAVYMLFCIFLAINRVENAKGKLMKVIYIIYMILSFSVLYLTNSRFIFVLLLGSMLLYLVIKNVSILKQNKKNLLCFIVIILGLLVCVLVYVNFASQYSKPCDLTKERRIQTDLKLNEENTMYIDLEYIDGKQDKNLKPTQIQIVQVNEYLNETILASKNIEDLVESKTIEFIPTENIYLLKLKVVNRNDKEITINKCFINDKEYVFESKYMPKFIYQITQTLSMKDKSVMERANFYDTCILMAKGHWLIGQGGNTWKKLYRNYQKYPFYSKETHSYFFELLISYGILGVVSFFVIIILLLLKTIKGIHVNEIEKKNKLSILFGLMTLLFHTLFFDFNMSFIVIIMTVFGYIAMLQLNDKQGVKLDDNLNNIVDYGVLTILVIIFFILIKANIARYLLRDDKDKAEMCDYVAQYQLDYLVSNSNEEDILAKLKLYIEKEPYSSQDIIYELYWKKLFEKEDTLTDIELEEYAKYGVNVLKRIRNAETFNYNRLMKRVYMMVEATNGLSQSKNKSLQILSEELRKQIIKEYEANILILTDFERNYLTKERSDYFIETYQDCMKKIDYSI